MLGRGLEGNVLQVRAREWQGKMEAFSRRQTPTLRYLITLSFFPENKADNINAYNLIPTGFDEYQPGLHLTGNRFQQAIRRNDVGHRSRRKTDRHIRAKNQ
jgi:hypothetical protein